MRNSWHYIRLNRMEINNSKLTTINRILEKRSTSSSLVDLLFIQDNNNNMKIIIFKHPIMGWEVMEGKETINSIMETSIVNNSKITLDRQAISLVQMIITSNSNFKLSLLNLIPINNKRTNNISFTFRI